MTKIYTNSSGIATIDLPDGVYDFIVRKDGFSNALIRVTVAGAAVNRTVTLAVPGVLPYPYPGDGTVPAIKDHNDAGYTGGIKYFDYQSGSNANAGTEAAPFKDFNAKYVDGIPADTAFLFNRGSEHPRIGRLGPANSWKVLYDMVWDNNLIGAYGTGAMPIIGGLWIIGYSDGNSPAGTRSDGVTIRDIDLYAESQWIWSWDNIVQLADYPSNITIAYNKLRGRYDASRSFDSSPPMTNGPFPYPACGIRGGSQGDLTIYNNEIGDLGSDGIFMWSVAGKLTVTRNSIYNVNRRGWGKGFNQDTGQGIDIGDGIKISGNIPNAEFHGNYSDGWRDYLTEHPSGSDWHKTATIIGTGALGDNWLSAVAPIQMTYNTFINSPPGTVGGGTVYFNPPAESDFKYNLVDNTRGGSYQSGWVPLTSYYARIQDHLQQSAPVRVAFNHLIKGTGNYTYPNYDADIDASNELFATWAAYITFLETNDPVGSDIDPDNFWT